MSNRPDYIVDVQGVPIGIPPTPHNLTPQEQLKLQGRPWLAMYWRCCEVYSRIYRNQQATAYQGRCPRCGKPVNVKVGPGGTTSRFFQAG